MADVSPPPVPGSDASRGGPRDSERGQLFLVGALALSVILVTLAVLLNTAIYTGNVATRDPGTGSADVIEYRAAANEMAGRTLSGVNYRDNESYDALKSNFNESIGNWSVAATKHSVVKGTDAHVSVLNNPKLGTRIVQHGDRNLTSAARDPNWILAENVQVRNFTLTVDQSTLSTVTNEGETVGFSNAFTVSVTDSTSKVWKVYVYDDSDGTSEVKVGVEDSAGGIEICSYETGDIATVDLTNASLGGKHCGALDFWSSSNPNFKIEYSNGNAAHGTYSLVVDEEHSTLESRTAYNADTADASPYVTPALYSAEVSVTYRSPTVDYSTKFRVAPGEYDD